MKKSLLIAAIVSTMAVGAYAHCGTCGVGDEAHEAKPARGKDCTKPCGAKKSSCEYKKDCGKDCEKACCAKKSSCEYKKDCGAKACGGCVCKDDCKGKDSCPAANSVWSKGDKEAQKKDCADKLAAVGLSENQQDHVDKLMAACDAGGCTKEAWGAMKEGLKDVLTVNQFDKLMASYKTETCCCTKACSSKKACAGEKKSCSYDKKSCSKKESSDS